MIGRINGGTETLITKDNEQKLAALSDQYILQLAQLSKEIEKKLSLSTTRFRMEFFDKENSIFYKRDRLQHYFLYRIILRIRQN